MWSRRGACAGAAQGRSPMAEPRAARPSPARGRALIFDFDGLILDTEWPEFASWRKVFADHSQTLAVRDYMHVVGTPPGSADFRGTLEKRLGRPLDWGPLDAARAGHRARLAGEMEVLPGVRELMVQGASRGWRVGVASNSTEKWVFGHLRAHGLDAWVETMRTRDNVPSLKPAPDPYLLACRDLDADPARSLAFEDSAIGVASAAAAGLRVVAVPNRITRHHDLGAAHEVVKSLQEFRLPE